MQRPDCLNEPNEVENSSGGKLRSRKKFHEYPAPKKGLELILAISWMMTIYDDVHLDYFSTYDADFCHLVGTVRKKLRGK